MQTRFFFLLIVSFSFFSLQAQDRSNRGKEFWLAYGFDYSFFHETPVNNQELAIYVSTELAATVTVTITNTGYTQTLNIPANTVDATILIPKTGANDARTLTDGLQNRGIHIVSNVPVAVYAHVYSTMVSGATMLMPVETYGYLYHSINYYQTTSQSNPNDWYSWFYAIASEDNTRLEITPSDTTKNGWLRGQTYTVNLNKGESYHVFGKAVFNVDPMHASKDMTGSKIVSVLGGDGNCHPVAVFSGSGGIRMCRGDGGEFMHQQVFPAQAWGTRYLTYHTINNTTTDILETNRNYYRICVADPTTVVRKNGVVMTGLIKNFFYEHMDSTGGDYFEADKPIMVSQYTPNKNQCWNFPITTPAPPSYGDPEMIYISPIEQGQRSVLFYVSRKSSIDYVYANIFLPTAAVGSLRVDGNSLPANQIIPHPNLPSYSVALARFIGPAAQHTIASDSAFNATVYGLGNYESYGYNVGTLINNLNHYSILKNTFNTTGIPDTFTCPKTPTRLFIKLGHPATSIHWKLSQVPGITPNADSIITTPVAVNTELINGRTYYVYSLQQDFTFANTGTFNIPITYSTPVILNCNQSENASLKVVVKPGPTANFTIPSGTCPNEIITLTGASTSAGFTIASYLWNFPDATTQTTVDAVKSFPAVGSYNVRYRIFADNGCAGDTTKVVSIGNPVSLSIQATGKTCVDSVFTFTSSIPASTTNPPAWYWNFGDGQSTTVTTGNTVTHSYAAGATNIIVQHAVSFAQGCNTDTALYTIPIIHNNPAASFSFVTDTLCEKIPVRFTSSLPGINSWSWNFGNGTGNAAPPFYHNYNAAGSYNVSLVITDANGCGSLPATNPLTINPAPSINAGPDKIIPPGSSTTLDATIANSSNYDFVWTPATFLNATNILNPVANPDRKIVYTIRATDKITNCVASDSVAIMPITVIYVPTAFTPNNDTKNDIFRILGTDVVTQFSLRIFNRYGQVIFETSDKSKGWDGTIKGGPSPSGGYVYIVKYKAPNFPDVQVEKGSFLLIR